MLDFKQIGLFLGRPNRKIGLNHSKNRWNLTVYEITIKIWACKGTVYEVKLEIPVNITKSNNSECLAGDANGNRDLQRSENDRIE